MTNKKAKPEKAKPKKRGRKPKARYARNIPELINALRISKQTFFNYKTLPDFPLRLAAGYDLDACREFFKNKGLLNSVADETINPSKKSLKDQLTEKDIELRQINIDKLRGKLVEREIYNADLLALTRLFKSSLETLPNRFAARFANLPEIQSEAEIITNELLNQLSKNIRQKLKDGS